MKNPDLIDELALLGLKGGDQKGLTASDVTKALKPFLDRRRSELTSALERLAASGRAEEIPRKKGQRSRRWRPLQSENEPTKTRAGSRSAKQKAIRQLVATHFLKLELGAAKNIAEGDGIFAYYLADKVEEKFDAHTTVVGLAAKVASDELKFSIPKPEYAWERLIQKGLEARESSDSPPSESSSPSIGGQPESSTQNVLDPDAIAAFADQVKRTARTAKEGWFGPRKLFIHRAWEAWKTKTAESADLPAFKHRLILALRAGRLELSRADYPMGLEATDLEVALTHYGDEIFHFVTIDEEARP